MARTSPFVVDITALKRQPGVQRPFDQTLPPPDGLGLESAQVQADQLRFDLQLEFAGEELIAQGVLHVDWSGPCRRCLEPTQSETAIELREIFQKVPVEGETYPLEDEFVDLEPMVRETVLLHLPVAPLCREDCAGPDPERFPTSVESDDVAAQADTPPDPRWAALSELTFDE